MSRAAQTYILNKLHLECEPYLITGALIGFNRANYLGPASLRGCISVMDFICILNSYVCPVGTGSLRRHLSLSKHMDIGSRADIYTHWCWMTQQGQSVHSVCSLKMPISCFYERLRTVSVVSLPCPSRSRPGHRITTRILLIIQSNVLSFSALSLSLYAHGVQITHNTYQVILLPINPKSTCLSDITVFGCWSWTGRPVMHFFSYCLVESPSTKNWPPFRAIAIAVETELTLFVFFLRIVGFLATGGSLRS